jgi:hypothetical protein
LPSGTALSVQNALTPVVNGYFDCTFVNIAAGAETLTITGATGCTVIGTAAVPAGKNVILEFFQIGTNAWDCFTTLSA